jgi:hypothetical protein
MQIYMHTAETFTFSKGNFPINRKFSQNLLCKLFVWNFKAWRCMKFFTIGGKSRPTQEHKRVKRQCSELMLLRGQVFIHLRELLVPWHVSRQKSDDYWLVLAAMHFLNENFLLVPASKKYYHVFQYICELKGYRLSRSKQQDRTCRTEGPKRRTREGGVNGSR